MPKHHATPEQITEAAVNGDAKGVAIRLGKNVSYIYKMCTEAEHNRYGRLLQLYYALNDDGADILAGDFFARHIARKQAKSVDKTTWCAALQSAIKESGEAIAEALAQENSAELTRQVVEGMTALQNLLVVAHQHSCPTVERRADKDGRAEHDASIH